MKKIPAKDKLFDNQTHMRSVMNEAGINEGKVKRRIITKRDHSVDITKNSSEVLRLLSILKKRKADREKKAWIPSGPLKRFDGYLPSQKVFY
jgi:hypothetical protein